MNARNPIGHTAIEQNFPSVEVSQLGEQESWRKEINRPLYHIHKWWATRLGSVFRAITLGALSPGGSDIWKGFYDQHNLKGKIVFDPFMGSGTTLQVIPRWNTCAAATSTVGRLFQKRHVKPGSGRVDTIGLHHPVHIFALCPMGQATGLLGRRLGVVNSRPI